MSVGTLDWVSARAHPELLAAAVGEFLSVWEHAGSVLVAPIDPALADTAAFCERYDVAPEASANCVIVAGRRGDNVSYAACMILATNRADVNGVVRRRLDARKASFAAMDEAVSLTRMEYGGITPLGLPAEWPVLVDDEAAAVPTAVIGSGTRWSKLALPGHLLGALPAADVLRLRM